MNINVIAVTMLVVVTLLLLLFLIPRGRQTLDKPCFVCGGKSLFGYSDHAETDPEKIMPMCLKCLVSELQEDYASYGGRALVVQPASGPSVYVFQGAREWKEFFKDSKIADDVAALLSKMDTTCRRCGEKARFLWVESHGLNGDNVMLTLDKGLTETLLLNNPRPVSLCAKCTVSQIARDLQLNGLSYLEVAAPKGSADGFVIPMDY